MVIITDNNNKCLNNTNTFRIEDNVLIGQEISLSRDPINISEVLLKTMKSKPDFVGQIDGITGKVDTYASMSERSIKCALWLKKQGVKPGDIIGLCSNNNLDAIIVMLSTWYVGAISNTWDDQLSLSMARFYLSLISPTIVFTVASSAANLTQAAKELQMNTKIVVLDKLNGYESFEDTLKGHNTYEISEFKCVKPNSPDDIAFIVPSSGTTGMPKGTIISYFSLYTWLNPIKIGEMVGHSLISTATLRWIYGAQNALKAIAAYSTRIIVPDNDDEVTLCELIDKYQITYFATDSFMLIKFLKNGILQKYRFPKLKKIVTSGAHFKKEYHEALTKKLPHVFVCNRYGLTDAGGACCMQTKHSKPGSVGFIVSFARLKVVDLNTEKNLRANEVGELRFKVPSVMRGYYKNPEATKKMFDSEGWLRTGDMGYYDERGEIYIVDRISEFINFRSITVSPALIEAILETHPAVSRVAVMGIPDKVDEQHPMAVVVRMPDKTVTEEELVSLVEKNMPDQCRLRGGVKFVDVLPRTATGKISKKKLRDMFAPNCTH